MAQSITDRLEALARGPKPFRVVTEYACGKRRELACHSRAAADNHANMVSRKIGRELIDRDTGATVMVARVFVEAA